MRFVDTHCHIHFADYELDPAEVIEAARADGVEEMILVGCGLHDSQAGPIMAAKYDGLYASIGLHPHEAERYVHDHHALQQFHDLATNHSVQRPSHEDAGRGADEKRTEPYISTVKGVSQTATKSSASSIDSAGSSADRQVNAMRKVVAIGEIGLDYYYENSPKEDQKKLLRFQLDIAAEHGLPVIFHVREAFDDFFAILDDYKGIQGVVHSFTSDRADLDKILSHGLYVGLNGIMTFTKRSAQLEAAKATPLEKLLLETDAPFLTPAPFRGKICEPKHVRTTAEFLANLRDESLEDLAAATTANAHKLFRL